MTLVTYTCRRCAKQFDRAPKKAGYRYCSPKCSNLRQLKLTADKLRPYVERGARSKEIAYALGVAKETLRRAMLEHGFYSLWASRRYKKCAVTSKRHEVLHVEQTA